MQKARASARSLPWLVLAPLLFGSCVKREISSEERLEQETKLSSSGTALSPEELAQLSCGSAPTELAAARSDSKPEGDRVVAYMQLFDSLKQRTSAFELAMTRNPDLAYQDGSQALVAAREGCVQSTADVRMEFESFVRDLVEVPTVREIKGGATVIAPRLDFKILREAIESLSPEDKDQLLTRVAAAEKQVERVDPGRTRKKGQ